MRQSLVTIQLMNKARDAANAEADKRLEHRAQAKPDTQPLSPAGSLGS
jgi:hypothetical protein